MRIHARLAIAATTLVLVGVPGVARASGDDSGGGAPVVSDPIATGLVGPLQIAVGRHGEVVVAQQFAEILTRIGRHGTTDTPIPGLDGIDVEDGKVTYATRVGTPGGAPTSATLARLNRDGSSTIIADLLAYETEANPDASNSYGFEAISDECAAQLPAEIGPPQYTGQIDSNPFAVDVGGGRTFVADAGANAILEVSRAGRVRTVAVLPPQPALITADGAAALGLPECTVGLTYDFEPVPTDVELGKDGRLYVTTLPGGPESPALGARGAVHRINVRTGTIRTIGTGFLGATGVAVSPHGDVYVAELFAGRVSQLVAGGPETLVELDSPSALEFANGRLYVSYDVFANGTVATIELCEH